jgi:hypothetical protein
MEKWARSRNGRRKPRVPIEKLSTGGTAPTLNNDEAWRIVPSPPSVMTKSIFSAPCPVMDSYGSIQVEWDNGCTRTPHLHALRYVWPVFMEGLYTGVVRSKMADCFLRQRSRASKEKNTHLRKESMVSITGFVRSLFTIRIDLTCSAFVLS